MIPPGLIPYCELRPASPRPRLVLGGSYLALSWSVDPASATEGEPRYESPMLICMRRMQPGLPGIRPDAVRSLH